jgi:predicted ABC-type ATPase
MNLFEILKSNPNHDPHTGKFTHFMGAASALAGKRPFRSDAQIVHAVLPAKHEQEEFLAKSNAIKHMFDNRQTSKNENQVDGKYTKDRKRLHKEIVDHVLGNTDRFKPAEGEKPRVVLLGGRGGSGKSNFDEAVNPDVGVYSKKNTLVLNSDRIKELIPGYTPEKAALFHHESADILSKAVTKAKNMGLNTVLDLTMARHAGAWVKSFKKSGYRVEGAYIHRPEDLAAETAISRWQRPDNWTDLKGNSHFSSRGRLVPTDVVRGSKDNEKNFDRITPHLDSWKVFDNSTKIPSFHKVAEGGTKFAIDCTAPDLTDYESILKFDPYHDPHTGKFSSGGNSNGGGMSVDELAKGITWVKADKGTAQNAYYGGKHIGNIYQIWSGGSYYVTHHPSADGEKYAGNVTTAKWNMAKKHLTYLNDHPEAANLDPTHVSGNLKTGVPNKDGVAGVSLGKTKIGLIQAHPNGTHVAVHIPTETYTEPHKTQEEALSALAGIHANHINGQQEANVKPVGPTEEDIQTLTKQVKTHTPGGFIYHHPTTEHGDGTKTLNFNHNFSSTAKAQASHDAVHKMYEGTGAKITPKNSYYSVSVKVGSTEHTAPMPVEALHKILHPEPTTAKVLTDAQIASKEKAKQATMKKALEKDKAEFAEKFPILKSSSLALKESGKNSAAKTKENQIQSLKNKMTSHGATPAEVEAEALKAAIAFVGKKNEHAAKAADLAYAYAKHYAKALKASTGGYLGSWAASQNPELKEATEALQSHLAATAGYHGGKNQSSYINDAKAKLENDKQVALKNYSNSYHTGDDSAANEHKFTADSLGATQSDFGFAEKHHLGVIKPATDLQSATDNLHDYAIAAHKAQYTASYDYGNAEKNKLASAKAKYDLAAAKEAFVKHGGSAKYADSLAEADKQAGYTAYDKEKNKDKYVKADLSKAITDAASDYAYKAKDLGKDHPDTQEAFSKLEASKESAKSHPEYPLPSYQMEESEIKGKVQGQMKYQGEKETATEAAKKAIYAAEMTKVKQGLDHSDTAAAMLNQEQAVTAAAKYLTPESLQAMKDSASKSAENLRAYLEGSKELGPLVSQRIADYDSRPGDFKFREDPHYCKDTALINSLSPPVKATLVDYTGDGYTSINKSCASMEAGNHLPAYEKDRIRHMDEATEKGVIDQDMKLVRNFPAVHVYKALGLDYSKSGIDPEAAKALKGQIFRNCAFSSTSMRDNWSSAFADSTSQAGTCRMQIRVQKGMNGCRYSGSEAEVILPRGTNYAIRDAYMEGNTLRLKVDVINYLHGDV